mgnify:CR=1 FL=1
MDYYTTKRKSSVTPIYSSGRVVGSVRGETFRKVVLASKHFLRQPPAIAVNLDALEAAERAGALRIEVYERESGVTFGTSIAHFKEASFSLDRGFGLQIALPLEGWTRSKRGGGLEARQPLLLEVWK